MTKKEREAKATRLYYLICGYKENKSTLEANKELVKKLEKELDELLATL